MVADTQETTALQPHVLTGEVIDGNERDEWEQQEDEPVRYYQRFHTYLMLGRTRSVRGMMRKLGQSAAGSSYWYPIAEEFNWKSRAEAWDQEQMQLQRVRREEVMQSGIALDYERVMRLKSIGEVESVLVEATLEEIAADRKGYQAHLNRRYEVLKNGLEKTLDALAAETGGRVKRVSVTRDLVSYAEQLAQELGYDIDTAREIAKLVAAEGD